MVTTHHEGIKSCRGEDLLLSNPVQPGYPSEEAIRQGWQPDRGVEAPLASGVEGRPSRSEDLRCAVVRSQKRSSYSSGTYAKCDKGRDTENERQRELNREVLGAGLLVLVVATLIVFCFGVECVHDRSASFVGS